MEQNYGIIGCGHISKFYFDALGRAKASIVHLCDLDMGKAKALAEPFSAQCSTDYKELINDPKVTTVVVLAHARFHKEICLAAIGAGKNVVCEKTLANSAQDALEIANAAKESGVLFFTSYMKRFFPAVQRAKELIPGLGVLYSAYARSYQFWGNLFEPPEDFSPDLWLNNYGGGALKCAGSHILDLALFLFGRPGSLYGNVDYVEGTKLDRKVVALLEYENSLTVNFEATGHCLSKIGYQRNNWDERIEINGTKGQVDIFLTTWDKPEECAALLVHYDEDTQTSTEYRFDAINTFHAQIQHFHDCLSEGRQGHPDVVDGYNVDQLISSIFESSSKKIPVDIAWEVSGINGSSR